MPVNPPCIPEELTIHHVREHAGSLLAAASGGGTWRLDLSGVSHIDTAGLQLLLMLRREALRAGTQLVFADPAAAVADLATFFRLGALLDPPLLD